MLLLVHHGLHPSFDANFDFWPYCRKSWECYRNGDGSITLSAFNGACGGTHGTRCQLCHCQYCTLRSH